MIMRIIPCTIFRFYLFYAVDRVIFCRDHFLRDTEFHSTLIIVIESHHSYSIDKSLVIRKTRSYLEQDYNLNFDRNFDSAHLFVSCFAFQSKLISNKPFNIHAPHSVTISCCAFRLSI